MRYWLVVLALLTLPACVTSSITMVSTDLLPGKEYRPNPIMKIHYSKTEAEINRLCRKKIPRYRGPTIIACAIIPADPKDVCHIYIQHDSKYLHHETGHCHGYADTFDYNKAHPDYLSEKQKRIKEI